MRPIAPRTGVPEQTVAEEQEEYRPMTIGMYAYLKDPADPKTLYAYGHLTRWTLSPFERKQIAAGEDIYIMLMHAKPHGVTPMEVRTGPGDWAMHGEKAVVTDSHTCPKCDSPCFEKVPGIFVCSNQTCDWSGLGANPE